MTFFIVCSLAVSSTLVGVGDNGPRDKEGLSEGTEAFCNPNRVADGRAGVVVELLRQPRNLYHGSLGTVMAGEKRLS